MWSRITDSAFSREKSFFRSTHLIKSRHERKSSQMQYRINPKNGKKQSLLGFGTMRLPLNADGTPNEEESIRLIRYAIDHGVNYIDTAYTYHDGLSEVVTGKALQDGYREKVFLADKMATWMVKKEGSQEALFETQLRRCNTDHFDYYLIHNLYKPVWNQCKKLGTVEFIDKLKKEGKVTYVGFSFHGNLPLFKEIIDCYEWDFCQIQLNYMDADFQAGVEGLKYAAERGLPVIIMEPLKGGKLTDILPEPIEQFWKQADKQRTPAEWAFRWVADFPEVTTILSGMNTQAQLDENLRILSDASPHSLTAKEHEIISQVADKYNELIQYSCTGCRYCMPCPQKIEIPKIMDLYNECHLYNYNPKTKEDFEKYMLITSRPSTCIECGNCESHCPQSLPVMEAMKKAKEALEDREW